MTAEEMLKQLESMPFDPTAADFQARRKVLDGISKRIGQLRTRLRAEYDCMYALCDHADSYSRNFMGRDPGGGGCNTCGKTW
jgi:hypothetical protein